MATHDERVKAMMEDDPVFAGLFPTVEDEDNPTKALAENVAALFSTELGRKVLAAMEDHFVKVTIVEPGQSRETHGIRQGQANVVFWIQSLIAQTE